MPLKFLRKLMGHFNNARFYNVYGATETNDTFMYEVPKDNIPDPLPIGKPLPYVKYLIINARNQVVTCGQKGESVVAAPTVMKGYWAKGLTANSKIFIRINGGTYYRTNDVANQDMTGNIYLHGRKDDIVKSGGYRINLLEIEKCLISHPDIIEAVAIPIPDDYLGNKITAVVCHKPQARLLQIDLRRFCGTKLPRHMIPHAYQLTAERIRKTPPGKIDKNYLKRQLAELSIQREAKL